MTISLQLFFYLQNFLALFDLVKKKDFIDFKMNF